MKRIMVLAGEPSGDRHAAALVEGLRAVRPGVEFFGMGGERMARAGVRLEADIEGMAVVGLVEVIRRYGFFRRRFRQLLDLAARERPDAVILVDYPGFNLRFARALKKRCAVPVIYYIAPQLWAWGRGRGRMMARLVDLLVVILPFEADFFRAQGLSRVFCCGHPALEYLPLQTSRDELRARLDVRGGLVLTLLPGSRTGEVARHLPVLLDAADLARAEIPDLRVYVACAGEAVRAMTQEMCAGRPVRVETGLTHELVTASDLVVAASGTATLETGIIGTPMIILYKVSFWTWLVARFLVSLPVIGLVNIVLGRRVAPEFIQFAATPERIAREVARLARDGQARGAMRAEFEGVRRLLGGPGASGRAARAVSDFLDGKEAA